jgi:hypothetical protein
VAADRHDAGWLTPRRLAIAGRALENHATSHRRSPDCGDDLLSDQPQSGLDGDGGHSFLRREGGRDRLHIPARHLWRVLLGRVCCFVDNRFRRLFHFTFIEAVALTKVLNMFSSLVFAREGLVDWRLGLILSPASFAGGLLGAVLAKRVSDLWLRRIFVVAVIVMASKTLLLDVPAQTCSSIIVNQLGSCVVALPLYAVQIGAQTAPVD